MDAPDTALAPLEVVLGFCLALTVGGAVGLERERHAFAESKPAFGGARTFPLVALLGALLGLVSRPLGPAPLAVGLVAVAALLGLGYWGSRREAGSMQIGLTSEFAALVVFVVGALPFLDAPGLSFTQRLLLGGAIGTVVMSLLALRRPIHEFAERLSYEDLLATVRFALVAVVLLPLLPDRSFDPLAVLNPFRIGVVVVLIAGISFVGYVAVRLFGERRGLGLAALAGGLVSSTAVTLSFAQRSREHPRLAPTFALGIAAAATTMFARVVVEVAAIRPALVLPVALPLGAMLAAGTLGCLALWRRPAGAASPAEPQGLRNPFQLRQALRLGLVFVAIRLLSALAWERFGEGGLLASAAVAGLADVDAITISVARMHAGGLPTHFAVVAITLAAATNTLVKVGLAAALGGPRLGARVGAVLVPAAAAGGAVALLA